MIKSGMNVPSWRAILASSAAGLVVTMFSVGCSTPASLPPKIAVGLDGLRNEAVSLRGQIEKTVGALNELMSKPQADLSPQFQSYTHELGILQDRIEKARQQRGATDTVVKEQFMAWDESLKQLHNEATREGAAERRADTDETYSGIKEKIVTLRNEANPFLNDLKDVRQYLNSDLTKEGLSTIEPTANRVFEQKDNIINRLDEVIQSLDTAIKSQ
ncbi:MAG: DUF2959 family protein [Nitrospirales bacterium]|nr:DUF2959 family protein [Nitrospirales bacterium]